MRAFSASQEGEVGVVSEGIRYILLVSAPRIQPDLPEKVLAMVYHDHAIAPHNDGDESMAMGDYVPTRNDIGISGHWQGVILWRYGIGRLNRDYQVSSLLTRMESSLGRVTGG